jgi:hypothetical protein
MINSLFGISVLDLPLLPPSLSLCPFSLCYLFRDTSTPGYRNVSCCCCCCPPFFFLLLLGLFALSSHLVDHGQAHVKARITASETNKKGRLKKSKKTRKIKSDFSACVYPLLRRNSYKQEKFSSYPSSHTFLFLFGCLLVCLFVLFCLILLR